MKLEQSKKKITTPMINTISFDNFLRYARVAKDDIHYAQLEFYSKVVDFLDIFVRIQTLVKEEFFFQKIINSKGHDR